VQVGAGAGSSNDPGAAGQADQADNKTKKLSRWVNSHYCFRGTFIMQTFGAACERMPNIWDQPPMQSEGVDLFMSKRADAPHRGGRSRTWLKSKNPASAAVRQEREEEWR